MGRIRSIKPTFVTDGKNMRLTDSCALFFILLWGFCDDEGKHRLDYKELAGELAGRWQQDKLRLYVSCLVKSGQLRLSSCSGWLQVVNWSHQRIDRPRQPSVKSESIQWVDNDDSTMIRDISSRPRRKDRIGEDRIGEDRIVTTEGVHSHHPSGSVKSKKSEPITNKTWSSYEAAYLARYGVSPVRNASVNGRLANFVKRIGQEESPLVAEFYLTHNNFRYTSAGHSVAMLLLDAEKLRTEWATNKKITFSEAKQAETNDVYLNQLKRIADGTL